MIQRSRETMSGRRKIRPHFRQLTLLHIFLIISSWVLVLPTDPVQGTRQESGCQFPDFLQSIERTSAKGDGIERKRDWRTHWREAAEDDDRQRSQNDREDARSQVGKDSAFGMTGATVTVDGSVMRSTESNTGIANEKPVRTDDLDDQHRIRHHHRRHPFSYIRECVSIVSLANNEKRFFTTHRAPRDTESSYVCLQFVARSDSLVQVRQSPIVSSSNSSICLNNRLMTWNPWLLIDVSRFFTSSRRCPIEGGFNIRLYDRRRRLGVCDAYDGETRLESECGSWPVSMVGSTGAGSTEGLVFRFRRENCIPVGLRMRPVQRTFCTVSWTMEDDETDNVTTSGQTTFVVLRHDTLERAWCFRYTTFDNSRSRAGSGGSDRHLDQLSALLFVGGLHCVVGSVGTSNTTVNYVKVDLQRDTDDIHRRYQHRHDTTAHNVTLGFPHELCVDDYEACSFWSEACELETASSSMRLTCAKSCGQCIPLQRPSACAESLPTGYRGMWSEYTDNRNTKIDITGDQLIIGQFRVFRCIRWDADVAVKKHSNSTANSSSIATSQVQRHFFRNTGLNVWEQMFVTQSPGTGCRPRYACIQFKQRSSSVIYYRISQHEIWPPTGLQLNSAAEFNCSQFRYRIDVAPAYQSRNFKTIIRRTKRDTVDCRLPRTVDFEAGFLTSSKKCRGRLETKRQFNDTLVLTMDANCLSEVAREEFRCLDSTLDDDDEPDWLIISELTSPINNRASIVCWLFANYNSQRGNVVYRIHANDCHEGVGSRLASGTVQPEATLVEIDRGDELIIGWRREHTSSATVIQPTTVTAATARQADNDVDSSLASTDESLVLQEVNCSYVDFVETQPASDNEDWSFLKGQEVISVFDEPYIVPLESVDNEMSNGRSDVAKGGKNRPRHNQANGSTLQAGVSTDKSWMVLLASLSFVASRILAMSNLRGHLLQKNGQLSAD